VAAEAAPVFVPTVIQEAIGDGEAKTNRKVARRRRGRQTGGIIEVEIDGVTVRVGSGADAKTVAAVRLVRVKTVRADRGAPGAWREGRLRRLYCMAPLHRADCGMFAARHLRHRAPLPRRRLGGLLMWMTRFDD
jgi:hypothetical protein